MKTSELKLAIKAMLSNNIYRARIQCSFEEAYVRGMRQNFNNPLSQNNLGENVPKKRYVQFRSRKMARRTMEKRIEPTINPSNKIRKLALHIFNVFGQSLCSMGVRIGNANVDSILRRAKKRAGVKTLFDDSFIDSLDVLISNANQQSSFKVSGRLLFRWLLTHRVANRLQIDAALNATPEILKRPVPRPIFIAALPRTGTTLLHRLFNQDSTIRVPLFWEMQYPCPPPDPDNSATDPRTVQVDKELAILNRLTPQFKAIHEIGTFLPDECIMLFANDLIGDYFTTFSDLPDYEKWLLKQDFRPQYERHKKQLQLLQYRYPEKRWVLKAPAHLCRLRPLTHTYPDAFIIQTHRAPCEIIASATSMYLTAKSLFHHNIHPEILGVNTLESLGQIIDQSMVDRDQIEKDPNSRVKFIDVIYKDFVKYPIDTMRYVYAKCDQEWSHSIEQQLMTYLEENRQHKHGKHRYALEDFGLKKEQVDQRFAAYNNRFLK